MNGRLRGPGRRCREHGLPGGVVTCPAPPPCILSLGSIDADLQVRIESPPGATETAAGRELLRLGAGKAANVAAVARMLGCEVSLLGRVGDDERAWQALRPLLDLGVDLGALRRAAAEPNLGYTDEDIAALCETIETANPASLLVVDYEISPRAASQAVRAAHRRGLCIVVDPSFAHAADRAAFRLADALIPDESEAKTLTGVRGHGEAAAAEAALALVEPGPKVVCIRLDAGGCLLHHHGRIWRVGSHPAEPVIDASGTGDAFVAAFAVALFDGQSMPRAAAFAVAANALARPSDGTQNAHPTRERLQRLAGGLARPSRVRP